MNHQLLLIYRVIVFLGLLFALYLCIGKKICGKQFHFYLYLLLVLLVDILPFIEYPNFPPVHGYQAFALLSILYFAFFYNKSLKGVLRKIGGVAAIVSLLLGLYFQNDDGWNMLSNRLLLTYSAMCVFLCLLWFYQAIRQVEENSLVNQFVFWVSSGLLLWSVFYTLSTVGRFYLYENDKALSIFMGNLLIVVNATTYLLYFIGLFMLSKYHKIER